MKISKLVYISLAGLVLQSTIASAENSLDVLEQDLNQIQQDHEQAASQILGTFLSQLDSAIQSPDTAIALYQRAGGSMPDAAPIETQHEYETPNEKAARQARDTTNISNLAYILQVHCGLMRYGALFIEQPNQKGLHDSWISWLRAAAQTYPQLHDTQGLMGLSVSDSAIDKYLGFSGWGDNKQGKWKVKDLPTIYRTEVLDPLREAHNPDELAVWDIYIGMCQADEQSDPDKWAQIDYPYLEFQRNSDDFDLSPSTDKLSILVEIIKNHPTHPQINYMIKQVHQMLQDYRKQKSSVTPTTASVAPSNSSSL